MDTRTLGTGTTEVRTPMCPLARDSMWDSKQRESRIGTGTIGEIQKGRFAKAKRPFLFLALPILFVLMDYTSTSLVETASIAEKILGQVLGMKHSSATVLALYGDLGSGKTTFVQELGKFLGVSEKIQSPTFVIMKSYKLHVTSFMSLIHIDAYRLEKPEELARLGFGEVVLDAKNLIVIEWAERVEALLPQDALRIHFKFIDEKTREISFLPKRC